jgi:cell division protein FtsB
MTATSILALALAFLSALLSLALKFKREDYNELTEDHCILRRKYDSLRKSSDALHEDYSELHNKYIAYKVITERCHNDVIAAHEILESVRDQLSETEVKK